MEESGFLEITTPKIIASASEGGADFSPWSILDRLLILHTAVCYLIAHIKCT